MRGSSTRPADRRRQLGAAGEHEAARWYAERGYVVLDRNWRCREGELDLVLEHDGQVVFCEVKTRSSTRFGTPAEAVTVAKQRRLRRLAVRWLQQSGRHYRDLRFDVAAVGAGQMTVIEGAF